MALPSEFADLEPYLDWDLATEPERYAKRLASTMTEMQAFYDVAFPRLNDAIAYCDKFPLDDLPEDALHLLHLIYSLVMVAMAVEVMHQPRPTDAADAVMVRTNEPVP
jgi:phage-related baseplate assembly protein